jgi:hypothetical protein
MSRVLGNIEVHGAQLAHCLREHLRHPEEILRGCPGQIYGSERAMRSVRSFSIGLGVQHANDFD